MLKHSQDKLSKFHCLNKMFRDIPRKFLEYSSCNLKDIQCMCLILINRLVNRLNKYQQMRKQSKEISKGDIDFKGQRYLKDIDFASFQEARLSLLIMNIFIFLFSYSAFSKLTVVSPAQLRQALNSSQIQFSSANFGHIPYGRKLVGELIKANPQDNCNFETKVSEAKTKQNKFVLVQRGNCSFVKKALNVQEQNGFLTIVYDNIQEDSGQIIMSDDGQGYLIRIPTVIVNYEQGKIISDFMENHPEAIVKLVLQFGTHFSDILDIKFFLTNSDRHSSILIRQFKPFLSTLKGKYVFKPIWQTYSCPECASQHCFQDNKYCATAPLDLISGNGQDIITQMLRQHFVYQSDANKWWDYMDLFDQYCDDYQSAQTCSDEQLVKLGLRDFIQSINKRAISQTTNPRGVLYYSRITKIKSGVIVVPDVVINNITYHGQLEAPDIYELACNSLNRPPRQCNPFINDPSRIVPNVDHKSSLLIIGLSILGCLLFIGVCMMCVYRRYLRRQLSRQMSGQIGNLVSQFITLHQSRV